MPKKKTVDAAPELKNEELVRAAVNLAADKFALGDRVFDIKDLPYDDYLAFVSYLQPVIDGLINRVAARNTVNIPGIELTSAGSLNVGSILSLCSDALPKMVCIMCRQTDPNISVEEVKRLAGRPTVLANAVARQMNQNGIIKDFADFFGQMVQTLKLNTNR